MIYLLIILAILSASLFAYEETQEWLGTKWGDIREHIASVAHRFSLIVLGYAFTKYGELTQIPLLVGLYWLCTDGIMNLMKKRNFFAVSNQSGNPFEKWNLVKYALIIVGVIVLILKFWR